MRAYQLLFITPFLGMLNSCTDEGPTMTDSSSQSDKVCNGGRWECRSRIVHHDGRFHPDAVPQNGYMATDLADAYSIPTTTSVTATVAIVDAYGYQNLASDLAQYRSANGLPACTIANGCLKIVNQSGQTSPLPQEAPAQDDWTVETALDADMASAGCPTCNILVVQADDDQGDGLFTANDTAAQLGATVVSNSWGGPSSRQRQLVRELLQPPGRRLLRVGRRQRQHGQRRRRLPVDRRSTSSRSAARR